MRIAMVCEHDRLEIIDNTNARDPSYFNDAFDVVYLGCEVCAIRRENAKEARREYKITTYAPEQMDRIKKQMKRDFEKAKQAIVASFELYDA